MPQATAVMGMPCPAHYVVVYFIPWDWLPSLSLNHALRHIEAEDTHEEERLALVSSESESARQYSFWSSLSSETSHTCTRQQQCSI